MKRLDQFIAGLLAAGALSACAAQSTPVRSVSAAGSNSISVSAPAPAPATTTESPIPGSKGVSPTPPNSAPAGSAPAGSAPEGSAPPTSAPTSTPPADITTPPTTTPPVSEPPVSNPPTTKPTTTPPTITPPATTPPITTPPSSAPHTPPGGITAEPPATIPAGNQLTLHGTVLEGVERGCLLLKDATTGLQYNLTGGNTKVVKAGATLTLVGVVRKDLMSYCQQGQILQVLRANAN